MRLRDEFSRRCEAIWNSKAALRWRMHDVPECHRKIYHSVAPFTMTSPERIISVCNAVAYVVKAKVDGCFVECGVWRGGSSMAAALSFIEMKDIDRDLYLFDTFNGMSEPGEHDKRTEDKADAAQLLDSAAHSEKIWCKADLIDVKRNMTATNYPIERIHYCQGLVEDTIPHFAPEKISILRLDTDWYESTRLELEILYPRLSVGGVLIIDDYGYWAGARKAVDDYFADRPILLNRIDQTGRIAVKLED